MRRDRIVRFALAAFFFGCAGQVFFDSGVASAQAPAAPPADPAAPPPAQANGGLQRQVTLTARTPTGVALLQAVLGEGPNP